MLANRTCVEQDDVGVFGAGGGGVACAAQYATDQLRVGDIHLAAIGLDKDARRQVLVRCEFVHFGRSGYQGFADIVSFATIIRAPRVESRQVMAGVVAGMAEIRISREPVGSKVATKISE